MPRVVHFEIHADNPERAIKFYSKIFGWEFNKWDGPMPYWLIKTGNDEERGIDGGMVMRQGKIDGEAVIAYVCTITVDSIDEYISKIESNDGIIAVPKMPIPGQGWLAYAKDTEGNIFGIMQSDENAK